MGDQRFFWLGSAITEIYNPDSEFPDAGIINEPVHIDSNVSKISTHLTWAVSYVKMDGDLRLIGASQGNQARNRFPAHIKEPYSQCCDATIPDGY